MSPSLLRFLKPYFEEIFLPKMKLCFLVAEATPLNLALEWQKSIPNAIIYNLYGPTEATVYCSYYRLKNDSENLVLNGMLSVGKLFKNVVAIVIDEKNKILSSGQKGELCISGEQVSPGYWKDKKRNEKLFINVDYKGNVDKFYRTGDLCFKDDAGNIMLFGRKDSQVKIQGYRVELGEIEFHARKFLKGINVVVLPVEKDPMNIGLIMFIETGKDRIQKELLLEYLRTNLASYMIPEKIMLINNIPLNNNGKTDKLKLKRLLDKDRF
jgi:acyl-coenzyme A synthetase/AMP-(fatty) acid ligase